MAPHPSTNDFSAARLDVAAFARAGATLSDALPLAGFERLLHEASDQGSENLVQFQAQGALRPDAQGGQAPWLHLQATLALPLTCQRCLATVETPLQVARDFRFVATEAQAEAEDDASEEDVLALSQPFDLLALLEDELLMAIPLVPKHAVCPQAPKLQVADADFDAAEEEKPHPFAQLAQLKTKPPG